MTWQPLIAWIVVALAGLWLARRVYRLFAGARRGELRGCGNCTKNLDATKSTPLVKLDRKSPRSP